ncbi:MAG: LysM peptidoglycan-binding domain-containing protein [Planctomycetes bacterium]|nr:LysM peptidoglycan-binding domain-containing protein [Planctomycetota bacterium]
MDRGVKIAIFIASIVSLSLGLIWDQVLSNARVAVQSEEVDELGPETMQALVGPPEVLRAETPKEFEAVKPQEAAAETSATSQSAPAATAPQWTEYVVLSGDSWWKLAHNKFKDRGLEISDLQAANPGVELKPGVKLRIPPFKGAGAVAAGPAVSQPATPQTPPNGVGGTEYTVQEGDSWWKIAHVRFKDRGLSSEQLEAANPGVKLRAGSKIKIP